MRRVFEERWRELPPDLEPWQFEWRRDLLLSELRDGEPWLDLGCGDGRFTALAPNGTGVDIAEAALERARARTGTVPNLAPGARSGTVPFLAVGEDGTIPLGHGEVELVWCSQVIERVPDALGLLQECKRVLRPAGRLLLTTPHHALLRRLRATDPMGEQVRFFTRRTLGEILVAAGFHACAIRSRRGTLVAKGRA